MHAYYVTAVLLYGLDECWWSIANTRMWFTMNSEGEHSKICVVYAYG